MKDRHQAVPCDSKAAESGPIFQTINLSIFCNQVHSRIPYHSQTVHRDICSEEMRVSLGTILFRIEERIVQNFKVFLGVF